jgi:ATP-dependent helicase YprA (DUF1998 family)
VSEFSRRLTIVANCVLLHGGIDVHDVKGCIVKQIPIHKRKEPWREADPAREHETTI